MSSCCLRFSLRLTALSAVLTVPLLSPGQGFGIGTYVSSNAGPDPFHGININTFLGANTFYSNGYTGSRSVICNVEGGLIWSGHETLGHVTTDIFAPGFLGTQLGQFDRHATWVGMAIGGRPTVGGGEYQRGIAYGATLWSGAVATTWSGLPYSTSFGWSNNNAFIYPYLTAMTTGVNGRTADVVTSSWGYLDSNRGFDPWTIAMDGMIADSHKAVVFAAGNSGPGSNTLLAPANGNNEIVVGSVGSDTTNPAYSAVSSFSSRGPEDYNGPDGLFLGARARVDILAPGENLTLAYYGGSTGGNSGGTNDLLNNEYSGNAFGTSFATPTTAGGLGLIADVAYDRFAADPNAHDGRVLKAVALNSATKLPGWTNGQVTQGDGSVVTTQALDYNMGAGRLNLATAFSQFTTGTTEVSGSGGGTVQSVGWDFGTVTAGSPNVYLIDTALVGGTNLTATLSWYVKRTFISVDEAGAMSGTDDAFDNLDLALYSTVNGNLDTLVGRSSARFIDTQHLSLLLPRTGTYALQVSWATARYGQSTWDDYGLAWSSTPVPEPGSMLVIAGGLTMLLRKRRRA